MISAGLLEYASILASGLGNLSLHSLLEQNTTAVLLFALLIVVIVFFVFKS